MGRSSLSLAAVVALVAVYLTGCGGSGGSAGGGNPAVVTMTTTSIPNGTSGVAYSADLEGVAPHAPGVFYVTGGALPPGLTLDTNSGAVTGYPRQVGGFHVEIGFRDGVDISLPPGRDATFAEDRKPFNVNIALGPPHILPQQPPAAQYRASYGYQIDVAGGTAPFTFAVTGGTLPAGLTVSSSGHLGSFPTQVQATPYEFNVTVTDAHGLTDTALLSVSVIVLPLIIFTSNPIPQAAVGFPYDLTLTLASAGGGAPWTWTQVPPVAGETLLSSIGMQLTTAGHVVDLGAGVAAVPGTYLFTVRVTDEPVQQATRQLALTVNPGPVLTNINPKSSAVSGPYTATGLNFQPGAALIFKPGATQTTVVPVFVSATTLTITGTVPKPSNGNGSVPVMVRNPDGGTFTLNGAFTFPAANISFNTKGFLSSSLSSTGLDVADVNGDGFADIVHSGSGAITAVYNTVVSTNGGLNLHMNLGGNPPTFSTVSLDSGNYTDVKFVDVNTDGKLDIVALGHSTIRAWLGNGAGGFAVGPTSNLPGPGSPMWPSEMTFGRFNSDSIPDVAYGTPNFNYLGYQNISGRVYSMSGTGTGAFNSLDSAVTTITNTYGCISLQAIDTDGDGRAEIAAGCGLSISAGPALNYTALTATGAFVGWSSRGGAINPPLYSSTTGTAVLDLFGTGSSKQLVTVTSGSPNYSNAQVLMVHSGTTLSTLQTLPSPGAAAKSLSPVDADFDTKMDFAVSILDSKVLVYRGSTLAVGATLDAAVGSPAISSPRVGRIASGDINGDGAPDIIATTSYWAVNGMASNHGTTYSMNDTGNGGSLGIVFWLNTSN